MADDVGRARTLAKEGRVEEALKLCFQAIEASPQNMEVRELAVSLSLRRDLFVEWAHQLLELAELYHQHSRHDDALNLLNEFLAFSMDGRPRGEQNLHSLLKRQVFFQKGRIHRDRRRLLQAERSFRESLTIAPDRWETYFELGRTLIDMARYQEAAQVLQDGRHLGPVESAPVLEALGDAYHHLGRDARKYYESAVSHYKNKDQNDDVMRVSARLVELFGEQYLNDQLN